MAAEDSTAASHPVVAPVTDTIPPDEEVPLSTATVVPSENSEILPVMAPEEERKESAGATAVANGDEIVAVDASTVSVIVAAAAIDEVKIAEDVGTVEAVGTTVTTTTTTTSTVEETTTVVDTEDVHMEAVTETITVVQEKDTAVETVIETTIGIEKDDFALEIPDEATAVVENEALPVEAVQDTTGVSEKDVVMESMEAVAAVVEKEAVPMETGDEARLGKREREDKLEVVAATLSNTNGEGGIAGGEPRDDNAAAPASKKAKSDPEIVEVKETASLGEEKSVEKEPVQLGPKTFHSPVEMFTYFYDLLHAWVANVDLNKYENLVLSDLIRKGHRDAEAKIGSGIKSFQVRFHPGWHSRCYYLIRTDGTIDDFSYRKCVDKLMPLPEDLFSASGDLILDKLFSTGEDKWGKLGKGKGGYGDGGGGGKGGGGSHKGKNQKERHDGRRGGYEGRRGGYGGRRGGGGRGGHWSR